MKEHDAPGRGQDLDQLLDPRRLRALSHPLRLRLRSELAESGPATASQLAARIGVSSGLTSYHLRQLASYGFVTPEPDRGSGRERYWRANHRGLHFPSSTLEREPELGAAYLRAVAQLYAERLVRFADAFEAADVALGPAWSSGWTMSDWPLELTPQEADDLARRIQELCRPYRWSGGRRTGTRRVTLQLQLLPAAAPDR